LTKYSSFSENTYSFFEKLSNTCMKYKKQMTRGYWWKKKNTCNKY